DRRTFRHATRHRKETFGCAGEGLRIARVQEIPRGAIRRSEQFRGRVEGPGLRERAARGHEKDGSDELKSPGDVSWTRRCFARLCPTRWVSPLPRLFIFMQAHSTTHLGPGNLGPMCGRALPSC